MTRGTRILHSFRSVVAVIATLSVSGCSPLVVKDYSHIGGSVAPQSQVGMEGTRVCALVLNTRSVLTPADALPSIWATENDPVFVRVFTKEMDLLWKVRLVSDRPLAEGLPADTFDVLDESSRGLLAETETGVEEAQRRCGGTVYYHDVVLDPGGTERSRVYALVVDSGDGRRPHTYMFNVRRYSPIYFEAATGPVVSMGVETASFSVERSETSNGSTVRLQQKLEQPAAEIALGALLRPWGYNPLSEEWRQDWKRRFAIYLATPFRDRTFETFYGGLGYGGRGMTIVGGVVVYPRRVPNDGVTLGDPLPVTAGADEVDELTRQRLGWGWFLGLQLNSSLFSKLGSDE